MRRGDIAIESGAARGDLGGCRIGGGRAEVDLRIAPPAYLLRSFTAGWYFHLRWGGPVLTSFISGAHTE